MATRPSGSRARRPAWRVLEHGTRLYEPSGTKGVWRVVFTDAQGRSERTARSVDEALEIARRAESYLAARVSPRTGRTVADVAASYLELLVTKGRAQRYRDRQCDILRCWILPAIGDVSVTEWGPYESEQVLGNARAKGRAPATIQSIGATLRGLVTHAQLRRWLPRSEDPMADVCYSVGSVVEGESADFVPGKDIPSSEAAELLAKTLETMFEPHWGVACRLAAEAGLRWGELVALRPIDISLPPGRRTVEVVATICEPGRHEALYAKPTKSGRRRTAVYYASLAAPLAELVGRVTTQHGPEALLFPGPDGGFASRLRFRSDRLLPAMREANWEFLSRRTPRHDWHSLRHLAATTMLFEREMDLSLVAYLLGHADPSFTLRKYVGNRRDAIGRAMDATSDV